MPKMGDAKLKGIVEAKLNNTLGWIGGSLQKDRMKALDYYRGEKFGNEQDGRSAVVSRDVAESIDSMMPSLVKVFATTDTYVVFSARKPQDEQGAKQKTDYVNWVLQTQPNFFSDLQTSLKDGLLSRLGVFKCWWDESEEVKPEEYEGLTKAQYLMLLNDEDVEEVECTTRPAPQAPRTSGGGSSPMGMGMPQAPQNGGASPSPQGAAPPVTPGLPGPMNGLNPLDDGLLYDCKINRTNKRGKVCIQVLPPEEFLTERRTVDLESATFAAHRTSRTRSELIEMGFPKAKVDALPSGSDNDELNPEKINRFRPEDDLAYEASSNLDPSMEKIWVAECYIKVDYDGDGLAEWRKVTMAGNDGYEILDNEECDEHPFMAWSPYIQPHKLIGESVADKTMDIQLWKSTVIREWNDGMYFNNAPQLVVVEGQANMEDVLTRRPGGVIRTQRPDAVTPLAVVDNSQSCMSAISYIDSVRETRTGVRRFSSGLQGDELNPYANTATGANLVDDSSKDTIELIARNYAEMGLKPLGKRIAELTAKYQDKPSTVKLRGQWVDIDPSSWSDEMDVTVTVGLGTGNKDRTVQNLASTITNIDLPILQMQGGLNGPLITAPNFYNKLNKLTEAQGFKVQDNFYTDPATAPPQPPKPDPEMVKVQGQLQLAQQKGQMEMQQKQHQGQLDAQLEREKAQRQAQQEAAQAQADMATQRQEAELSAQLEHQKAMHQAQLDTVKMQHEIQLEKMRALADIEIAQAKARVDAHVKIQTAKAVAKAKPKTPK